MKNTIKLSLLGCIAVACLSLATPASATQTFGFAADPQAVIDSSAYEGFKWSGSNSYGSWINGTLEGLPSAPNAPLGYAWSNGGASVQFALATPGTFDFDSFGVYADHTQWGGGVSDLTITGYKGGVAVDSFTTGPLDSMTRGAFSTITLDWNNVDQVTFSESPNENVLYTAFTVGPLAAPVPEPANAALLLAGLGFLIAKRKRQGASK